MCQKFHHQPDDVLKAVVCLSLFFSGRLFFRCRRRRLVVGLAGGFGVRCWHLVRALWTSKFGCPPAALLTSQHNSEPQQRVVRVRLTSTNKLRQQTAAMPTPRRVLAVASLLAWSHSAAAVDRSKFRKCEHTSFCKDHRPLVSSDTANSLVVGSLAVDATNARITGEIRSGDAADAETLKLEVQLIGKTGKTARVRINEHRNRWQNGDVVLPNLPLCPELSVQQQDTSATLLLCAGVPTVRVDHSPVKFHMLNAQGDAVVSANARNRFYFEQSLTDHGAVLLEAAEDGEKDKRTIIDWGEDGKPIYAEQGDAEGDDEEADDEVCG